MFHVLALIINIKVITCGYYHFTLLAPDIAKKSKPGQFIQVNVTASNSNDPLLLRPISLYRVRKTEGIIEIIFKIAGRGTNILANKKNGEMLEVLGPIGNGFSLPEGMQNIALIAGGIGMPPLYYLAEYLKSLNFSGEVTLFYGGRTKTDLLGLERWKEVDIEIFPATEDGSLGLKGYVTDLFLERNSKKKFDYLFSCGPVPMLKTVQKIAGKINVPGQLSLEAHMACGVGACLGCVCNTVAGYQRVCVDGPVFALNEVIFDEQS